MYGSVHGRLYGSVYRSVDGNLLVWERAHGSACVSMYGSVYGSVHGSGSVEGKLLVWERACGSVHRIVHWRVYVRTGACAGACSGARTGELVINCWPHGSVRAGVYTGPYTRACAGAWRIIGWAGSVQTGACPTIRDPQITRQPFC